MKNFTLLLSFLICGIIGFSQQKQGPDVYLNSEKIDYYKVYINGNRMDSVWLDNNCVKGAAYVLTKDRKFTSLNLKEILTKYTDIKDIDSSALFKINGKLIQDTLGVRIDDTFFIYVEVKGLSGVSYLKESFREMKIVSIDLEKEERKPVIWIK